MLSTGTWIVPLKCRRAETELIVRTHQSPSGRARIDSMKYVAGLLLLMALGHASADRVIQLSQNAFITISKVPDGKLGGETYGLRLQFGDYDYTRNASGFCFTGALFILLDPFAPLDGGFDGHLKSRSLLEITEDNVADLQAEDFNAFSFFSTEKTTIGLIENNCGASGRGSHRYVLYDLKTNQLFVYDPPFFDQTQWGHEVWCQGLKNSIKSGAHPSDQQDNFDCGIWSSFWRRIFGGNN